MSEMTVLKEAHAIIYGDREKTYGHPSKNLKTIAVMWNAYINASSAVGVGWAWSGSLRQTRPDDGLPARGSR